MEAIRTSGNIADKQDLRLRDKSREMVHKGPLKRRGGNRDEIADLLGFLFDHAFLLAKPKHVNKAEQLRVYRRVSFISTFLLDSS